MKRKPTNNRLTGVSVHCAAAVAGARRLGAQSQFFLRWRNPAICMSGPLNGADRALEQLKSARQHSLLEIMRHALAQSGLAATVAARRLPSLLSATL